MSDGSDPRVDLGVAAVIMLLCAAVLWEARDIPPGVFEPLGSAPVPRFTAVLIILLCLVVAGRSLLRWRARRAPEIEADRVPPRLWDAAVVMLLTVAYVAALHLRLTTFAVMTTVFLTVAIGTLLRVRLKAMPIVLLVAAVTGFGCQYVFTRIFIVDLPGL
jgi:Tripartite tricarboxylate transporter TctB family